MNKGFFLFWGVEKRSFYKFSDLFTLPKRSTNGEATDGDGEAALLFVEVSVAWNGFDGIIVGDLRDIQAAELVVGCGQGYQNGLEAKKWSLFLIRNRGAELVQRLAQGNQNC